MEQGDVILLVHNLPSSPPVVSSQPSADSEDCGLPIETADELPADNKPLSREPARFSAHRKVLASSSEYFRSLFSSNFKEADQDIVAVHWDADMFAKLLAFIYGAKPAIEASDVVPLIQSAYMFGVDSLLESCRQWVISAAPIPGDEKGPAVALDIAADLWSAASEVAGTVATAGMVVDLCVVTLAVFFEAAVAQGAFKDASLELLLAVVNHDCLTIRSETVVCQTLLEWARHQHADMWATLCKSLRWAVLPLPFLLGLRQRGLSPLELPGSALQLASQPQASASSETRPVLAPECLPRLSPFSRVLDLSRCQQLNEASFFTLFQQPCTSLTSLDISHCWRLTHPALFRLLPALLPNLTLLNAADCPNLPSDINLFDGHPRLQTLDLSVSHWHERKRLPLPWRSWMASPRAKSQIEYEQTVGYKKALSDLRPPVRRDSLPTFPGFYAKNPNLTRLSLRSRGDVDPALLNSVGMSCGNLTSLDVSWCAAVCDSSLAGLVFDLTRLEELRAAGTGLGAKTAATIVNVERVRATTVVADWALWVKEGCPRGTGGRGSPRLRVLDASHCKDLHSTSVGLLVRSLAKLEELSLAGVDAKGMLLSCATSSLRRLNVNGLALSPSLLAALVKQNPQLKHVDVRGCNTAASASESHSPPPDSSRADASCEDGQPRGNGANSRGAREHTQEAVSAEANSLLLSRQIGLFGAASQLETLKMGWGFTDSSLRLMGPALCGLRSLTLGLGAAVSDAALGRVSEMCPLLEHLRLRLLMISEDGVIPLLQSAQHLQTLSLHHCAGPFTSRLVGVLSTAPYRANLRTLKLVGRVSSLEDHDLVQLTRGLHSLEKLALSGARKLTPVSLSIIAQGWPALRHLTLENCGSATAEGADVLLHTCLSLESLKLAHNGRGLPVDFFKRVRKKMPLLTSLSVDDCDVAEGRFAPPKPGLSTHGPLQSVEISKCKRIPLFPAHGSETDPYAFLERTGIDTLHF